MALRASASWLTGCFQCVEVVTTVALVLVGMLSVGLIIYGYARRRFSRRLRETDHLHGIVRNLLDLSENCDDDWIKVLLERLARTLGADSAWLLAGRGMSNSYVWSSRYALTPAQAEGLTRSIMARFPWRNDRIVIAPDRRSEIVQGRKYANYVSFRAKALMLRSNLLGEVAILGFTDRAAFRGRPEIVNAVTVVFGAMLQTMHRQVTARQQLKQEREAAIGRRMETIGIFATGMAHNLNNVLAAIGGFNAITELHVEPDSVVGRSTADIDTAVRRAQMIVREVLSFGRRLERTSSFINVRELLTETAAMIAVSLPKSITLDAGELPLSWQIVGNFGHFQQILLNICSNAAFAMPGGGTIRWDCQLVVVESKHATSHAVLDPGTYVTIAISDHGSGMTPAVVARIFEPFFTTRDGGTGLGLSTAQDIIRRHAGAIDVRSRPGEGSAFTLWLPANSAPVPPASAVDKRGGGEVVLIINADPIRLAIDEELVATLGYDTSGLVRADDLDDFEGFVDLILIAGVDADAVRAALEAVHLARWKLPIVIAVSGSTSVSPRAISYPFRPVEIASALSDAVKSMPPREVVGA